MNPGLRHPIIFLLVSYANFPILISKYEAKLETTFGLHFVCIIVRNWFAPPPSHFRAPPNMDIEFKHPALEK